MDKTSANEIFINNFSIIENFVKENFLWDRKLNIYVDELKFYLYKLIRNKKDLKDMAAVTEIVYDIILNIFNQSFCKGFDEGSDFVKLIKNKDI